MTFMMHALAKAVSPSEIIDECRKLSRDKFRSSKAWKLAPSSITNQDGLVEIVILLGSVMGCTSQQIQWEGVFDYLLQSFNDLYTPAQYPQIFAQIVAPYVIYSSKIDCKQKQTLIDKSLKYFDVKYMYNVYDKGTIGNGLTNFLVSTRL